MVTAITKLAKVTIDGQEYEFPAGMNLVDAAKHIGVTIPVFCYHPKMKPVGMCRMCLVEVGNVQRDRATGAILLDEAGNPQIRWMPKLQTACTMTATDGVVLRTTTDQVEAARRNVVEFLLTSHPLDCPICDKGGECPLQNQTMDYGPGTSRMNFEDKKHLDKHVPLGDLIFLDEERCIQCGRCVRYQDEIVGDDVLAFHDRGRDLQIVTNSEPPFDTYFSGNTTDICPVGALTTSDFRFGARPWEMNVVPSICPHCPVGCNLAANTRQDRDFGGRVMIKRMMPRQNELVNEIWICDKGRFGHHFSRSGDRLLEPLARGSAGALTRVTWDEAYTSAAAALKGAGGSVAAIAGPSLSNEDGWTLRQLVTGLGGSQLGLWPPTHGGLDLVAKVGVGKGTNLSELGAGDAVLIIATDLEEEAPIYRHRLKVAHDRGATIIVANARHTRMADFADISVTYATGEAASFLAGLNKQHADVADRLAKANNLVIFAGAEGLSLANSRHLLQAAANLLTITGHVGKPNNGLIAVTPGANAIGLQYLGYSSETTATIQQKPPKVLIVAQADISADDPAAAAWLAKVEVVIQVGLYSDDLTERALVALPSQSFAERDGSFTNGERRVQRFYTAQGPMGEALPAWTIFGRMAQACGSGKPALSAAQVMNEIAANVPAFTGCQYTALRAVEDQFPLVGGDDLYYGGTQYKNGGGMGVQIATSADAGERLDIATIRTEKVAAIDKGELLIVPTVRLYNRERTFLPSAHAVMSARVPEPYIEINAEDAAHLKIEDGAFVQVTVSGQSLKLQARVNGLAPKGTALLPRNLHPDAAPLQPTAGTIAKV